MRLTTAQYLAYLQRTESNPGRAARVAEGVECERDLQEQIEDYCKAKMWPYARTRMDKATTYTVPGVPDFIIAGPMGQTFWIECKTRRGKATPAQNGFGVMLTNNHHEYYLVRSFDEFLQAVN